MSQPPSRRHNSGLQRREAVEGFLWISPWIIGFVIFTLGPMLASLYLSFTRYSIGDTAEWIGMANYQQAFTTDPLLWPSLGRTVAYALMLVFFGIILSLLAALLLNQEIRGRTVFRALFYLPSLTPVVSLAIIWGWLLQPQNGLVNYLLGLIGIDGPGWLTSRTWVIPSIVMISLWSSVGGGRMIIFLAGLQGVPQPLYEAAKIDGAGQLAQFRHVTLPLISPTILFNAIISITGSFSVFSLAYIATEGGLITVPTSICCICITTPSASFKWDTHRRSHGSCLLLSSLSSCCSCGYRADGCITSTKERRDDDKGCWRPNLGGTSQNILTRAARNC